jgi:hypothetical protein
MRVQQDDVIGFRIANVSGAARANMCLVLALVFMANAA